MNNRNTNVIAQIHYLPITENNDNNIKNKITVDLLR